MKTNSILIGAVALVLGLVGGHLLAYGGMQKNMKPAGMHGTMSDMTSGLEGKDGTEFEKAFLAEMIVHHAGAVAMARMVLEKSERPELSKLANDIIAAQTTEIGQMREWQKTWFGVEEAAVHHAE